MKPSLDSAGRPRSIQAVLISVVYKKAASLKEGGGPAPGQILLENLHGQSPTAGKPDLVAPDGTGGVMVLTNLTK